MFAFGPLFPALCRASSAPLSSILSPPAATLLSAVLLSNACFIAASGVLFALCCEVTVADMTVCGCDCKFLTMHSVHNFTARDKQACRANCDVSFLCEPRFGLYVGSILRELLRVVHVQRHAVSNSVPSIAMLLTRQGHSRGELRCGLLPQQRLEATVWSTRVGRKFYMPCSS